MVQLPGDSTLSFPHIMQVKASAGSGKTYLLAMRFVQFLLSFRIPKNRIPNLLAITFTNDAAQEMRRRVLNFLKELALQPSSHLVSELSQLVTDNPNGFPKRAKEVVDELLRNYDFWQVRTIDSFLHQIVEASRYELGLSPEYEIDPHQKRFLQKAMDDLLLKAQRDTALFNRIEALIRYYLTEEEKASWWPHGAILEKLTFFYEEEQTHGMPFIMPFIEAPSKDEIKRQIAEFLKDIQSKGLVLNGYAKKAMEKAINGRLEDALKSPYFGKHIDGLFNKSSFEFIDNNLNAKWGQIQENIRNYAESRAVEDFRPYFSLLKEWKGILNDIKMEERTIFFGDINLYVQQIYRDFAMPELFFRLGERIFHVLIDEFQDTSLLQWKAIGPLIEEALSRGGSLFCVGDSKQLLYRWRGADPDVFDVGPDSLSLISNGIMELALDENWRSHKVIVDFVGSVFHMDNLGRFADAVSKDHSPVMLKNKLSRVFEHVHQKIPARYAKERDGGFVYLESWNGGKVNDVMAKACEWTKNRLNDILTRYALKDVFILLRKKDQIAQLTAYLTNQGIAVRSEQQMDIRESRLVQDILAMLQLLHRPSDRCVAQVLTCGLFEPFWRDYSDTCSPWQWLEKQRVEGFNNGLLSLWMKDMSALWENTFGGPLRRVRTWPVYDIVSKLLQFFDYKAIMPHEEPVAEHLLDLLYNLHGQVSFDIQAVLDWFATGPEEPFMLKNVQSPNAVRIMTIHKSKGLQAPVVLMPVMSLSLEAHRGPRIVNEKSDGGEEGLLAVTTPEYARNVSKTLNDIAMREKEEAWLDELRCLYVAMTRAEEELYMLIPEKKGNSSNHFMSIYEGLETIKENDTETNILQLGSPVRKVMASLPPDEKKGVLGLEYRPKQADWAWQRSLRHRPFTHHTSEAKHAMAVGGAVHFLLSRLLSPLPQELKGDEAKLHVFLYEDCKLAIQPFDIHDDFAKWSRDICRVLCKKELERLFWPPEPAVIWTERELVAPNGELYRMDRVVQCENEMLIAEFKTGEKQPGDEAQLKTYLSYMVELYRDMRVTGWLVYVSKGDAVCLIL